MQNINTNIWIENKKILMVLILFVFMQDVNKNILHKKKHQQHLCFNIEWADESNPEGISGATTPPQLIKWGLCR